MTAEQFSDHGPINTPEYRTFTTNFLRGCSRIKTPPRCAIA